MLEFSQVELPFEQGGYTQSLETLLAIFALKRKHRGPRRTSKPNLDGIDLNQSLLPDTVWGIEHAWQPDVTEEKVSTDTDLTQGCFKHLKNRGRNTEFSVPSFEDIALIASKLLYDVLDCLYNTRGNAKIKQDGLDWIFATNGSKPMHKIPFTAQFCCMVEEIDYELLCEALNDQIDCLRESQAPVETVDSNIYKEMPYGYQDNSRAVRDELNSSNRGAGCTANL